MVSDNRVIGCFAVTVHTVTEINFITKWYETTEPIDRAYSDEISFVNFSDFLI